MTMRQPAIRLWYNPACSKCRGARQLLEEAGCEVEIYEYLTHPPNEQQLREVLAQLGVGPRAICRDGAADAPDDDALITAMLATPMLIQRPIAIRLDNGRALLARPPELALQLLDA